MTLRAVVDPNVFISAQISSLGHPARIARAVDRGVFELVVSERLLSELHDVLMRPRFGRPIEGEPRPVATRSDRDILLTGNEAFRPGAERYQPRRYPL